MKKKSNSQSAFLNLRVFIGLFVALAGVFLALLGVGAFSSATAQNPSQNPGSQSDNLAQIFRPHLLLSDDAEQLTQPLPPLTAPLLPIIQLSTVAWTSIGPAPLNSSQATGNVSGRIAAIAAHPTDANTIYVAPAGGGVWKTITGGTSWTALTDTQSTLSMGAVAIARSNPLVIYAGTGEANNSLVSNFGRGILVSTNAGTSFTLNTGPGGVFNTNRMTCSRIAVDPTNASIAYAAMANLGVNGMAVGGITGVYKTTDSGSTWANVTAANGKDNNFPWSDVVVDPNTPNIVYAAVGYIVGTANNGVYKSTDSGTTWTLLNAPNAPVGTAFGRISVAISKASNMNVLYIAAEDNTTTGGLARFVRSDNAGASFTDLTAGTPNYMGGQGWYDTTLIVDPTSSAIVYAAGQAGTNSMLRSTNSGANWTDISHTNVVVQPHADHHGVDFDANGKLLDGDDGGIYRLADPTVPTWANLNGNLNTIQFLGIGLHPTNPNIVIGGSQDNGTELYTGALLWTEVEGGDGGLAQFSPTNGSVVYHQAPVQSFGAGNFFRRSTDGGANWIARTTGMSADNTQNFYAPFSVDPGNGNRVLYGATHVWETTNAGDLWTAIATAGVGGFNSGGNNVDAIGIAPSDVNTTYASTGGQFATASQVFVTTNHGGLWTEHDLPAGSARVNEIRVDPSNAQIAYAVVNRFSTAGHVFRTTNGGTWTNISGTLPNLPVWSIQIDNFTSPSTLYIGADDGVYTSTDLGVNWSRLGTGLPNAQVFQVTLNSSLHILGAATHGRGAWEIQTAGAPTPTPTATATATFTPTPIPTATFTPTSTPTSTPTATATATFTPTPTPTATHTPTPTATATATATATFTPTPIPTATATATFTPTPIPTATATATFTPTPIPTATATATFTPTPIPTATATATFTPTPIPTATATATFTPTPIPTATATATFTPTPIPTATATATFTPTPIPTATATATFTPTPIPTATFTPTPTATHTPTSTPTATATATFTPTPTPTPTATCQVSYTTATTTGTITAGGTDIGNHCDDCTTDITLPFAVSVYGNPPVTAVAVGSDGDIHFPGPYNKLFWWPGCVPVDPGTGQDPFLNTLFPNYADLVTDTSVGACPGCGIFTQTVGTAPNRQFLIRWKANYFNSPPGPAQVEFEVVLTEGSNTLSVIYGMSGDNGLTAVSGIQKDLNMFTSFSCDQATLTPGLRVNYIPTGCGSPTPTPTATHTPTATPTATATATHTPTATPTATATATNTPTATPTATATATHTPTATPTATATATHTPTATPTATATATHTPTATPTATATATHTPTATPTATATATHTPTATPTATATATHTPTATPTATATATHTPTATPTATATATHTPTATPTATATVPPRGSPTPRPRPTPPPRFANCYFESTNCTGFGKTVTLNCVDCLLAQGGMSWFDASGCHTTCE